MKLVRLVLVVAVGTVAAGILAAEGRATRECDGLDVCIRVPGPWVAIPAPGPGVRAPSVAYELSCPRGSVAGGLDAVRGDRAIDIVFLGSLGSPVNPGITTGRSVVFVATYTGTARRPTTFRPLLGCIPTTGGGGRGTTSMVARVPVPPLTRRVANVRLGASAVSSGSVSCAPRERLVGSSHAVAFRTPTAPAAGVLAGVRVTRRERGGRVVVTARRSAFVPIAARAEVQVHALCGGRS
jgi:hypothetical protein